MIHTRIAVLIPVIAALVSASGCSGTKIPSPADLPIVYKIDVQQGNEVTQDMLAQLKPGMERSKVRFIMGTPLVVDTFHNDRWDYVFTMQKRGGERTQRRVSLFFRDDKLDRVAGDVKPAAGAIAASPEHASKTIEVPPAEKGLFSRVSETVSGGDADDKNAAAGTRKPDDTPRAEDATAAAASKDSEHPGRASTDDARPEPNTTSDDASAASDDAGEFVVDNSAAPGTDGSAAPATPDSPPAASQPPAGDGLMPRFQSESDLEDAVVRDSGDIAAEAASGSDADQPTGGERDKGSAAGGTGKPAGEADTGSASAPKDGKGFLGRLLEKVGVGGD